MLRFRIDPQIPGARYSPLVITNCFRDTFKCLIDTGAGIPVWTAGKIMFDKKFPDAIDLQQETTLYGFSKSSTNSEGRNVSLYSIKFFVLSDGIEQICYRDLVVALADMDEDFDMIISYSMLRSLKFTCDNSVNTKDPVVIFDYPEDLQALACNIFGKTLYSKLQVLLQHSEFSDDAYLVTPYDANKETHIFN